MNASELYKSRRKTARIAGIFYLILAVVFFPQMVRDSLIVVGDAASTGRNILDNAPLYEDGMLIAEVFMGLWLFPLGWLFYQSSFIPKMLGILLMVGCFAYLLDALAGLVMPEWKALTTQGVAVPGLVELATVIWLLIFGVKQAAKEKPGQGKLTPLAT